MDYTGTELQGEVINKVDCKDEVLALLSRRVEDLGNRLLRLERFETMASNLILLDKTKGPHY